MNAQEELMELAKKHHILGLTGFSPDNAKGAVEFIKKYADVVESASFPKELYHLLK